MARTEQTMSSFSPSGPDRVLLVGDVAKAFLDADLGVGFACDIRPRVLDAIEAAARYDYHTIGVVMAGLVGQLGPVLKALRRNRTARLVLLAQMYEEPIARRLIERGRDEEPLADAYQLCPTTLAGFLRTDQTQTSGSSAPLVDASGITPAVEQRIRHLERLATTDDLTGLKNRRYLWEFARQVVERARRLGGRVTLLVFDIDNFKHYNDVYGHPIGDEILRQAAILMQRCCRPHDVVGRIGGDEFAVVFWDDPQSKTAGDQADRRSPAHDHPNEVIFVARRFQKEFGNAELHLLGPEGQGVLTISGALARFPADGATVQELFERADAALLEAKRQGKNRIYLVGESTNDIADMP